VAGAFLTPHLTSIEEELVVRGISYEIIADGQAFAIKDQIANPEEKYGGRFNSKKHPKLPFTLPVGSNPGTMP
jgi:hypothetical protein